MKKLSNIINLITESIDELTDNQIDKFMIKFGKRKEYTDKLLTAIELAQKCNIKSKEQFQSFIEGNKTVLNRISTENECSIEDLQDLKNLTKSFKSKGLLVYMPQYIGAENVDLLLSDKLDFDDATMDFDTESGQRNIVKKYTSLIKSKIKTWASKLENIGTKLDEKDLESVAWATLAYCMKTYNNREKLSLSWVLADEIKTKDTEDQETIEQGEAEMSKLRNNKCSFRTYLDRMLHYAILIEINKNSRNIRMTERDFKNAKEKGWDNAGREASIDSAFNDEDSAQSDHYKYLGVEDKSYTDRERVISNFLSALEKQYKAKELEWFKKCFGLNGEKPMTKADIATEAGVSKTYVTRIINNIIIDIQQNPKLQEWKELLRSVFNENLGYELLNLNIKQIKENLLNNDMYVLFETLDAESNNHSKIYDIIYNNFSSEDANWLVDIVEGNIELNKEFYENKNKIVKFLNIYDIFENHNNASDKIIYNKMLSIINK